MGFQVFPVAATSSSSASGLSKAINLVNAGTIYTLVDATLTAGNYSITCPNTSIVTATFYNSSYQQIATGTTSSGSTSIIVPTDATRVTLAANTGSNVGVTLQLTGLVLTPTYTSAGTETITSSQTYTGTSTSGYAFVLLVGGGGAGSSKAYFTGGGGGSGGVNTGIVALTGSTTLTVGAGNGGTTSFGSLTATGGGTSGNYQGGPGGSPNGVGGGQSGLYYGSGAPGSATANVNKYIADGTTGSGGGSWGFVSSGRTHGTGAGSGIGTGGNGGAPGGSGSGYGAGGGGSSSGGGGAGTQGVVYIRRF